MGFFGSELFEFLDELAENNNKAWFDANRDRFEADVREPCMEFIEAFAAPLGGISSHFRAIPKTQGGSMFRIHRDTRFSKDKAPYKTNAALHFRHERAKDAHAPGYYLHLEPDNCFAGVGLWTPETRVQYDIREHLAENPEAWENAVASLGGGLELNRTQALKRPPKGFEPDHPLIEDLKLKSFMAGTAVDQDVVMADDFLATYTELLTTATPLMTFLCDAVGVDF